MYRNTEGGGSWVVALSTFSPSAQEAEAGASVTSRPTWLQRNSRTARATQGNLKNKTKQNKQNRFTKQVQKTTQEISSKTKA